MASLLASFRREKKRVMDSRRGGTGSSDIYVSHWYGYKYFHFLLEKDYPRSINTIIEIKKRALHALALLRKARNKKSNEINIDKMLKIILINFLKDYNQNTSRRNPFLQHLGQLLDWFSEEQRCFLEYQILNLTYEATEKVMWLKTRRLMQ
ncbi:uncharacterized protein LOC113387603 [Ctenocephalides felis]|uniref:uncharacterized protein LOC113364735 n=1 Tax=Ctenocephalides felis TaxID=7515 RepID=UPI000E6E58C5|nr:uncharacterized protein LOC113364735 [Ctenocephalides felis]XP_026480730.1 uncharacterized protein LOC113387603 [Ctenocephalides felis]XP_026480731.1 uncharacterized protein LOC113387603 [Ctenocephalides felis]XP_026480732.1 uncharacterized protein LOC113387603 [Ctenocephalides felis]XP_026480734.1 uncharacterized protein LOC113387603 [Ctenocephalides felis]XP_026480735.1 uncharacterized protein LOC113387603 [Ctenocephalides felis]